MKEKNLKKIGKIERAWDPVTKFWNSICKATDDLSTYTAFKKEEEEEGDDGPEIQSTHEESSPGA